MTREQVTITRERVLQIKGYIREWQDRFNNMDNKDCLFALYDDRMISGLELDIMMDQYDMELRLLKIAQQR